MAGGGGGGEYRVGLVDRICCCHRDIRYGLFWRYMPWDYVLDHMLQCRARMNSLSVSSDRLESLCQWRRSRYIQRIDRSNDTILRSRTREKKQTMKNDVCSCYAVLLLSWGEASGELCDYINHRILDAIFSEVAVADNARSDRRCAHSDALLFSLSILSLPYSRRSAQSAGRTL